jgi:hypothetical protein
MVETGAPQFFQQYYVIAPEPPERLGLIVDGSLHHALGDSIPLPAELKHLRHKGQSVQSAVAVQTTENFSGGPDFDEVARPQSVIHVISFYRCI